MNIIETLTSKVIFQDWAIPRITSDGIEVINAIGIKILKKILSGREKEVNGNLPT